MSHMRLSVVAVGAVLFGAAALIADAQEQAAPRRGSARVKARYFNPFDVSQSRLSVNRFGVITLAPPRGGLQPATAGAASPSNGAASGASSPANNSSASPSQPAATSSAPLLATSPSGAEPQALIVDEQSQVDDTEIVVGLSRPPFRPPVRSPFRPPPRPPFSPP